MPFFALGTAINRVLKKFILLFFRHSRGDGNPVFSFRKLAGLDTRLHRYDILYFQNKTFSTGCKEQNQVRFAFMLLFISYGRAFTENNCRDGGGFAQKG